MAHPGGPPGGGWGGAPPGGGWGGAPPGGGWGGAPPAGGGWGGPPGAWGGAPMGPTYELHLSGTKLDNKDRATGGKSDAYLVFKANRMRGGGMGPLQPKLAEGMASAIVGGSKGKTGASGGKAGKTGKEGKKKKSGGGLFGAVAKVASAATGVGAAQCVGASDEWMMVHKTEIVYENLNPTWKPIHLNLAMLAHNDVNQPFVIECWDWDKIGAHDFIGYVKCTMRELQATKQLKLLNPTRKIVDGGFGKLAGQLVVNKVTQTGGPPPAGAGGAWGAPPPGAWGGAPPGAGAWGGPPPGAGAWGGPPPGGPPPGGAWGPPPGQ